MLKPRLVLILGLAVALSGAGCGAGSELVSIQVVPADPTIVSNNIIYIAPGGSVQYMIQAWYGNQTVKTIASSSGKWSSTSTSIATVDSTGLAVSQGPLGVTTISASFGGRTATTVLSVCDPTPGLCPP